MTIQRVHLVRHGETENPDKIVYGARPFDLTPRGHRQAEAVQKYLRGQHDIGLVISSPVTRAIQTALPVNLGELPPLDDRLTETISIFDGERVAVVAAQKASWKSLTNPYRPSWGEPYTEVHSRMNEAVIDALHTGHEDVVLVSHQLPIWIYRLGVEGRPFFHDPLARQCGHASVTSVIFEDGEPMMVRYWHNPI